MLKNLTVSLQGLRFVRPRRFLIVLLLILLPIGLGYLTSTSISPFVAVVASALFLCVTSIVRNPFLSLGFLLIPLTALDSYLVLVRYRVNIAGLPIGLIDFGFALVAMSLLLVLLRSQLQPNKALLSLPWAVWFLLGITVVSTLWGGSNGNPAYEIIRHLRPILSFVLVYLASINILHRFSQIGILFDTFIVGTSLAAIQQIYRFAESTPAYLSSGSLSYLRQAAFQAPFYSVAFLMLLGSLIHRIPRSSRRKGYRVLASIGAILNLGALLVTMNRGPWICAVLTLLVFYIVVMRADHRGALLKWIGAIVLGTVGALLVVDLLLPSSFDLFGLLFSRAQSLLGDPTVEGEAFYTRLTGWLLDLRVWRNSNLLLGKGLGFRDYEPYLDGYSEAVGVGHNSYLFYLVRTGPLGLLALVWVLISFFKRSWNLYTRTDAKVVQLASWNSMAAIVYLSMNAMSSAPFHNERVMPVLGLFFGIITMCGRSLQRDGLGAQRW